MQMDVEEKEEQERQRPLTKKEIFEIKNFNSKSVDKIEKLYNVKRISTDSIKTEGALTAHYCFEKADGAYIEYKKKSSLNKTLQSFNIHEDTFHQRAKS